MRNLNILFPRFNFEQSKKIVKEFAEEHFQNYRVSNESKNFLFLDTDKTSIHFVDCGDHYKMKFFSYEVKKIDDFIEDIWRVLGLKKQEYFYDKFDEMVVKFIRMFPNANLKLIGGEFNLYTADLHIKMEREC